MSNKSKHTPGPWKVLDGAILCEHVNAYGNFHIASYHRGDEPLTDEDHANARLIAAAPETTAGLRRLVASADRALGALNSRDIEGDLARELCAAIADSHRVLRKAIDYNAERAAIAKAEQ